MSAGTTRGPRHGFNLMPIPVIASSQALDRWEERLEALFEGRPYDVLDAALTDTIARFPLEIQPFRDMIQGMRMDLVKSRYNTFSELYEYCYRVAGTVALMSTPIMGIDPRYKASPRMSCSMELNSLSFLARSFCGGQGVTRFGSRRDQ